MKGNNKMSNNKIDVFEFVDGYSKCGTVKTKEGYLKKLEIVDYINYEVKMVYATKIVHSSSYDMENKTVVKVNAPMRYILFTYTLLSVYTNLDMHSDKMFEEFNILNRNGLIDEIIALIPEREVAEFNHIVSMTYDDFLVNYYEPHSFISNQIDKIGTFLEMITPELADKISESAAGFVELMAGDD